MENQKRLSLCPTLLYCWYVCFSVPDRWGTLRQDWSKLFWLLPLHLWLNFLQILVVNKKYIQQKYFSLLTNFSLLKKVLGNNWGITVSLYSLYCTVQYLKFPHTVVLYTCISMFAMLSS